MKKTILICIVSALSLNLMAQEQEKNKFEFKKSKHQVGLHAGATTGLGFSYRYWPNKWGVQVTGIPIFDNNSFYSSIGLSGLCMLKENKIVDVYSYLGNHLLLTSDTYSYTDSNGNVYVEKYSDIDYNIGVGFGMKLKFLEVLDFNVQTGYGVYDILNSPRSMITGEVGLYYHI